MIYPSHWSNRYFGIEIPDKEPYRLVSEYAKVENSILGQLENPPVSVHGFKILRHRGFMTDRLPSTERKKWKRKLKHYTSMESMNF